MASISKAPVAGGFDLVVFDCDGVLIDSEMLSCGCLSDLLVEHGYAIDRAAVIDRFLGRSFSVVEEHCRSDLGRPLAPGFSDVFRNTLRERFARDLRPMRGVEAVLARLTLPCCVASSSDTERLRLSLALTELAAFFNDRVYSADIVRNGKPAPDLFLYAASRMQAAAERTLVIEDSVNGVIAGRAAGMTVWGFVGGSHYEGRDGAAMLQAAGAHRIVGSMAELPI